MALSQAFLKTYLFAAGIVTAISGAPPQQEPPVSKQHIVYLMQCREFTASIDLYEKYKASLGRHDFEILQQMAVILLEQGARSADPEEQLLSIFGSGLAGISSSLDILEEGLRSPSPQTQMASIQFLAHMQDDRSDELLTKAMSSNFFFVRMEAAYQLALRKHRKAVGQIEALMHRIPTQFHFFFPEFFALIGTSDAIGVLRHLMDDSDVAARIESILSAARHGRDDLLPMIRAYATHLNIAEQEACVSALGFLKDSRSLPLLNKLFDSPSPNVKLSAARSLYILGDTNKKETIVEMARAEDLFAISTLGDLPDSADILVELLNSPNLQTRFNAGISLLKHKDSRCLPTVMEILIRDTRDLGFQPQSSLGKSLTAWKVIPSARQHSIDGVYDLPSISLGLREQILKECLELNEKDFLYVAEKIFDSRQSELIPLLVLLIQNLQTPEAIHLLQKKAQKAGAPLVRAYCNLACYRLNLPGPYETSLRQWINQQKRTEMIRFRPMGQWNLRFADSSYEVNPEESSKLLIESFQALADKHEEKSIDTLLKVIHEGNSKNRFILAGLLIRAVQ